MKLGLWQMFELKPTQNYQKVLLNINVFCNFFQHPLPIVPKVMLNSEYSSFPNRGQVLWIGCWGKWESVKVGVRWGWVAPSMAELSILPPPIYSCVPSLLLSPFPGTFLHTSLIWDPVFRCQWLCKYKFSGNTLVGAKSDFEVSEARGSWSSSFCFDHTNFFYSNLYLIIMCVICLRYGPAYTPKESCHGLYSSRFRSKSKRQRGCVK